MPNNSEKHNRKPGSFSLNSLAPLAVGGDVAVGCAAVPLPVLAVEAAAPPAAAAPLVVLLAVPAAAAAAAAAVAELAAKAAAAIVEEVDGGSAPANELSKST